MKTQNIFNASLNFQQGLRIESQLETRQLCSGQDHAAFGSYQEEDTITYWAASFDGHGKNQAIEKIREADLSTIMQGDTPWLDLQTLIQSDTSAFPYIKQNSGSTMVFTKVKILPTHIEVSIYNIGDSYGVLFLNDEPVYVTKTHTLENSVEFTRLVQENRVDLNDLYSIKDSDFEILTPTMLRSIKGRYIWMQTEGGKRYEMSMTQSLGHNGLTGLQPGVATFYCSRSDNIRVCLCSDGVTDVLPVNDLANGSTFSFMQSTTTALLDEAERRWKQEWTVYSERDARTIYKTRFPKNGYDDCSCAMISVCPTTTDDDTIDVDVDVDEH